MKKTSLIHTLMARFTLCMLVLIVLSAPLFYLIVTGYYTEDLREAAAAARMSPVDLDLEEDTVMGLVFQILAMVCILGLSVLFIVRMLPKKLWKPFYQTLHTLSQFRVEDGREPKFEPCHTKEFAELNETLTRILSHSVRSYQIKKQFTENASHELQTPLAIMQGKLDLLLQDADLTDRQAQLMEDVYHEVRHMSQLSRNLLLLARIENAQYKKQETVCLADKLQQLLPSLQLLADGITIRTDFDDSRLTLTCNEVLLEAALNNLVVNAVRHNRPQGEIVLRLKGNRFDIANTSDEPPLDPEHIFKRFYQKGSGCKGNGLGLSIVKSICDYHNWTITYRYEDKSHCFTIAF